MFPHILCNMHIRRGTPSLTRWWDIHCPFARHVGLQGPGDWTAPLNYPWLFSCRDHKWMMGELGEFGVHSVQSRLSMSNHTCFLYNVSVTNYTVAHLIQKNQCVTCLKYVLWCVCGGWWGAVPLFATPEGLPTWSHSSLQTSCIIKQHTSLLGGIVCFLFEIWKKKTLWTTFSSRQHRVLDSDSD